MYQQCALSFHVSNNCLNMCCRVTQCHQNSVYSYSCGHKASKTMTVYTWIAVIMSIKHSFLTKVKSSMAWRPEKKLLPVWGANYQLLAVILLKFPNGNFQLQSITDSYRQWRQKRSSNWLVVTHTLYMAVLKTKKNESQLYFNIESFQYNSHHKIR